MPLFKHEWLEQGSGNRKKFQMNGNENSSTNCSLTKLKNMANLNIFQKTPAAI